jgi:hypothetical protein
MRRLALFGAGLAVCLAIWPGGASAAAPVVTRFTDTFPDEICGFTGSSTVNIVDVFTLTSDNMFRDRGSFKQTFTSDNGKSLTINAAGTVTSQPIQNPDGTVTIVTTFIGLPEKLQILKGPVLSLDAGTATITSTFRVDANGEVELVSQQVSGLHGPHPDLLSDFSLFCNVITPYLMDP